MLLTTRPNFLPNQKGFFPCQLKAVALGYQELGIWDHKIGNHTPIIQLLEGGGRVEFLPPFRHLTLGFMTCFTGKLWYTHYKSHSVFIQHTINTSCLCWWDWIIWLSLQSNPIFREAPHPGLYFPHLGHAKKAMLLEFHKLSWKIKNFPPPRAAPPGKPSNIFACLPSQDLQSPTCRLQVISPRQCPDSCENFKYPPWKFNNLPLKIGHPKRRFIFQPSIFRCHVSFREGVLCGN